MLKIGIVVPFFGKLPDNFQLWLNSCAHNQTIDWLLFTDDHAKYKYPPNVHLTYMTFDSLREKFQSPFDFPIALKSGYKICDYRVAFGQIFESELSGYDFWGYCDVDLVFGDIRKFITDEILDHYDKILTRGHLTLFRNTAENNLRYRSSIYGRERYREVLSTPDNCPGFNEWAKDGINDIYESLHVAMYDEIIYSDIYIARDGFYPYQLMKQKKEMFNSIFLWEKGCLLRFYYENGSLVSQEVIYVHLQKRKMELDEKVNQADRFLIVPNRYLPYDGATNASSLKPYFRDRLIYWGFIQLSWKNLRNKIKRLIKI